MLLKPSFFLNGKICEFFLQCMLDYSYSFFRGRIGKKRKIFSFSEYSEGLSRFIQITKRKNKLLSAAENLLLKTLRIKTKNSPLILFLLCCQHLFFVFFLLYNSGLPQILRKKIPQKKTCWQFSFSGCLKLCMVDMNSCIQKVQVVGK